MARKRRKKPSRIEKVVDETILLKRPRRGATLKEEVWQDASGRVTKYSLAYINPVICSVDNGRVLGYDNSHDYHHRHFMGAIETVAFDGYQSLLRRFRAEVTELWKKEDEEGT